MSIGWAELSNRILKNAAQMEMPVSAAFELTSRCNFQCSMCYVCRVPNDKEALAAELTAKQWIEIGRQARDAGLFYLTLTGGEVFLRKDFEEIYEAYSQMGFSLTIYTNGSLITPERAKWLGRIPPLSVSITIYGASPDTYKKVTGHADGYEKTIRAVELLKEQGIKVSLKTTVIEANHDEFEKLNDLALSYGIGLGIVNYVSPPRQGCGKDPLANRLSPAAIAAYEKRVEEYNSSIKAEIVDNMIDSNQEQAVEEVAASNMNAVATPAVLENVSAFKCRAGKCAYWVNWYGHMTPCGLLDMPYENILEKGFQNAWNSLKAKCLEVPKCQECLECSLRDYCMVCPARLLTETGYFNKPAQYLCETAKNRILLKTKLI